MVNCLNYLAYCRVLGLGLTPLQWSHARWHVILSEHTHCLVPMAKGFYFAMWYLHPLTDRMH